MKRYLLIKNIGRLVTMTEKGEGELGVISDAACLIKGGRIEWVGKAGEAPQLEDYQVQSIDAGGGVVMPGLIDCHTHLVHGGSREKEVAKRARGVSYEQIAADGGGILSTVHATRKASFNELCNAAFGRANEALEKGVTTIEVKSGYGLDTETELKMLRVIDWLDHNHPVSFIPTFLGAHTVPAEYRDKRERYVDIVINEMIPKVAEEGLAGFCDVFVEGIAFSVDEARWILEAGKKYGLVPKLHADQLTGGGGAELAAEVGAASADHLEHASDKGIEALAGAGVVAVMLPGSTFYLGQDCFAPAKKLIDSGLEVAISTDYNPGSTPSLDLFLVATIAMSRMKMTIEECLKGITVNAAKALQIGDGRGTIRRDGIADLIVLDAPDEYFPVYRYGSSWVKYVIKNGRVAFEKKS